MTTIPAAPVSGGTFGSEAHASGQSHNGRRQSRNKKGSDPFLELPDDAVKLPELSVDDRDENAGGHSKTLLADFVLTPINMISLILSLFLVDHQQRQWRLSQHSSGHETYWSRLTHWSWLDPQPYQEPSDPKWQHSKSSASPNPPDNSFSGWYTRKKHRAMAKLELSDAFEMRGRVMIALLAWLVLGVFTTAYAIRRMYAWMSL